MHINGKIAEFRAQEGYARLETELKNVLLAINLSDDYQKAQNTIRELKQDNENTNGLIRDYFPKGTDFSLLTKKELKEVQNQLNERPRKTLEYESSLNTISRLYMNQNYI
jgi:cell division protein ZapA (FtsZ GTPase activity inhibitor)